jgi:hypothetical protein
MCHCEMWFASILHHVERKESDELNGEETVLRNSSGSAGGDIPRVLRNQKARYSVPKNLSLNPILFQMNSYYYSKALLTKTVPNVIFHILNFHRWIFSSHYLRSQTRIKLNISIINQIFTFAITILTIHSFTTYFFNFVLIYLCISYMSHKWSLSKQIFIHSSIAIQSFVGPWPLLQFHNNFFFRTDSLDE